MTNFHRCVALPKDETDFKSLQRKKVNDGGSAFVAQRSRRRGRPTIGENEEKQQFESCSYRADSTKKSDPKAQALKTSKTVKAHDACRLWGLYFSNYFSRPLEWCAALFQFHIHTTAHDWFKREGMIYTQQPLLHWQMDVLRDSSSWLLG